MSKIKHWFNKLNKVEKAIFILFTFVLLFFLLISLINIIVALGYTAIKLKTVTWHNFSFAYAEDICFQISSIIGLLITFVVASFIGYKKWQQFDMFVHKQNKKAKTLEKELNQIPVNQLVMLNEKFGLLESKLNQHTVIVGTTGSGKTSTIMRIGKELANKFNETVIIIDGKGDVDLINKVKQLDQEAFVWTIGGNIEYNPFVTKNKVILADKIMSLFEFSEQYYKSQANDYLLLLLDCLIDLAVPITLANIVKYFNIDDLKVLIGKNHKNYSDINGFNFKDITGLRAKLNVYKQQLENSLGLNNSLLELIKNKKVILFSVDSLTYPELTSCVGNILIQDLKELASLKPHSQKINIIMDEFNVFISKNIVNLINKTRSFNYQCFLVFQTIDDLKIDNVDYKNIIFGNVSNVICQQLKDPETAEYISSLFGTKEAEKLTRQIDFANSKSEMGSIRSVDEFIVHPNELKNLKTGEAYIRTTLLSGKIMIKKIHILS